MGFSRLAFGSTVDRFDSSNVHPRWRSTSANPDIGPGYYDMPNKRKNTQPIRGNYFGWRRQGLLVKTTSVPKTIGRDGRHPLQGKDRVCVSGMYNSTRVFERLHTIPIMTIPKASRFPENNAFVTPGVGTYEVSQRNKINAGYLSPYSQQTAKFSTSDVPAPGTYNIPSPMDQAFHKVVGKRGPYDVTTGPRSKTVVNTVPAPGTYEVKSFLTEWSKPERRSIGMFNPLVEKSAQLTKGTRESTIKANGEVSPATYYPKLTLAKSSWNRRNPAFLTTSKRFKLNFLTDPGISVGPGRYDLDCRSKHNSNTPAITSPFVSKTAARPSAAEVAIIRERLKACNNVTYQKFTIDL